MKHAVPSRSVANYTRPEPGYCEPINNRLSARNQ
ncbi:hypothetical protein X946_466 [Burkholderia sp. ABCPW 111]|nr:hypothetical protein X946_466 [Burkholderia sp. ABCPW 111]